jgi:hypothetical protein
MVGAIAWQETEPGADELDPGAVHRRDTPVALVAVRLPQFSGREASRQVGVPHGIIARRCSAE